MAKTTTYLLPGEPNRGARLALDFDDEPTAGTPFTLTVSGGMVVAVVRLTPEEAASLSAALTAALELEPVAPEGALTADPEPDAPSE